VVPNDNTNTTGVCKLATLSTAITTAALDLSDNKLIVTSLPSAAGTAASTPASPD
jgi:hypothetical protein